MSEEKTPALDLDAIEARCNAATAGPWYAHATDDEHCMNARYVGKRPSDFRHDGARGMATDDEHKEPSEDVIAITLLQQPRMADSEDCDENTEFIAHAREDLPALITAHRLALAALAREKERVDAAERERTYYSEQFVACRDALTARVTALESELAEARERWNHFEIRSKSQSENNEKQFQMIVDLRAQLATTTARLAAPLAADVAALRSELDLFRDANCCEGGVGWELLAHVDDMLVNLARAQPPADASERVEYWVQSRRLANPSEDWRDRWIEDTAEDAFDLRDRNNIGPFKNQAYRVIERRTTVRERVL